MNDATEAMKDDIRRYLLEHPQASRRLTYSERCGAFYALYWGYSRAIVSEAFGIHPTTASFIADCLMFPDRQPRWRKKQPAPTDQYGNHLPPPRPTVHPENMRRKSVYQDIAREFVAIGEEEFGKKYVTDDIRNRLLDAVNNRHEGKKPRRVLR